MRSGWGPGPTPYWHWCLIWSSTAHLWKCSPRPTIATWPEASGAIRRKRSGYAALSRFATCWRAIFDRGLEAVQSDSMDALLMSGWVHCVRGQADSAVSDFESASAAFKKHYRQRSFVLPLPYGTRLRCRPAQLERQGSAGQGSQVLGLRGSEPERGTASVLEALRAAVDLEMGRPQPAGELHALLSEEEPVDALGQLSRLDRAVLGGPRVGETAGRNGSSRSREGRKNAGYWWLGTEASVLLARLRPELAHVDAPEREHREFGSVVHRRHDQGCALNGSAA